VPPPFVLVGHSYGGLVMRLLASRRPADVAGLVLIEPAIPEEWSVPGDEQRALIARGERLCTYGAAAAKRGLANAVAALVGVGALGPARALVGLISRGRLRREDEGILAPIWKLPPEARGLLRHAWTQPKFFEALGSQIGTICNSAVEVLQAGPSDYGNLPLAIVSAAASKPRRLAADAELARMSTRGRHVLAEHSGHWVPLDAPHVVMGAITYVVGDARDRSRPAAPPGPPG
jgi:pimeloyl-ACP methyl ester carboxylesterase